MPGRHLAPRPDAKGYLRVHPTKDGVQKGVRVHRAVAMAFICAPPTPEHQVNHKDGDRLNNHFSNLEWMTCRENIRHAIDHGLRATPLVGEKHPRSKLTEDAVREIRVRRAAGESYSSLAKAFGVDKTNIAYVATRKTWKHVS